MNNTLPFIELQEEQRERGFLARKLSKVPRVTIFLGVLTTVFAAAFVVMAILYAQPRADTLEKGDNNWLRQPSHAEHEYVPTQTTADTEFDEIRAKEGDKEAVKVGVRVASKENGKNRYAMEMENVENLPIGCVLDEAGVLVNKQIRVTLKDLETGEAVRMVPLVTTSDATKMNQIPQAVFMEYKDYRSVVVNGLKPHVMVNPPAELGNLIERAMTSFGKISAGPQRRLLVSCAGCLVRVLGIGWACAAAFPISGGLAAIPCAAGLALVVPSECATAC